MGWNNHMDDDDEASNLPPDTPSRAGQPCEIVSVGKRRDGGTRYWCVEHHANATAKYGKPAGKCVAADDEPISKEDTLDLNLSEFPGGVALWGSVPSVFDTTVKPVDRGIHVHARYELDGDKMIDWTYRKLRIPLAKDLISGAWTEVDEIDAINFMVSGVFGFKTIPVQCGHCGFAHLDRDWFAVHYHQRHQCHGCGKQFSDKVPGVGNPVAYLKMMIEKGPAAQIPAPREIQIDQRDFPGGIQIWGSNAAILWTSDKPEETGIHLHCFDSLHSPFPQVDNTYSKVTIDGRELDADHVRTYMAQSAMPHLDGRIISICCPACSIAHFDSGADAYTPHVEHVCHGCGATFKTKGQLKKTICNPFVALRAQLALNSPNPLRNDSLGLRPETI